MRHSFCSALFFPILLLSWLAPFTLACAEEIPLLYNNRVMTEISVDQPQYGTVDIGEIQPEDGSEPVFGILIPRQAVVEQDGSHYALVKTDQGVVGKKLQLGVTNAKQAEVVEGALPGDQVLLSNLDRVWPEYWKLRQLWDDPVRNPEVTQEITLLYRRFFNYTAITLIIAIPLILWLRKRARANNNKR